MLLQTVYLAVIRGNAYDLVTQAYVHVSLSQPRSSEGRGSIRYEQRTHQKQEMKGLIHGRRTCVAFGRTCNYQIIDGDVTTRDKEWSLVDRECFPLKHRYNSLRLGNVPYPGLRSVLPRKDIPSISGVVTPRAKTNHLINLTFFRTTAAILWEDSLPLLRCLRLGWLIEQFI